MKKEGQTSKLKQSKNNDEFNKKQPRNITSLKNEEVVSVGNRNQEHQNRDIIEVIQYIEQTMTTLANYREKSKRQLNSNLMHQEIL